MPFLSLGLSNDEQQASPEQNQADKAVRDDSGILGLSFSQSDDKAAKANASDAPRAQRTPRSVILASAADSNETRHSTLPPAVEELHRKLSDAENAKRRESEPEMPIIASDGTPTFTTFKFGYLPGRGLLYSMIGHELVMFGLFLLV